MCVGGGGGGVWLQITCRRGCVCVGGGGLATDNLQKGDSGGINLGGQTMADQRKMPNL